MSQKECFDGLVFGGLIDFEEKKIQITFLIVFVSYVTFTVQWYSE